MAWIRIEDYYLLYNAKDKTPGVRFRYREGGQATGKMLTYRLTLTGPDATFLADMLRYEKPVFFDPEAGTISTGEEAVGEQE